MKKALRGVPFSCPRNRSEGSRRLRTGTGLLPDHPGNRIDPEPSERGGWGRLGLKSTWKGTRLLNPFLIYERVLRSGARGVSE